MGGLSENVLIGEFYFSDLSVGLLTRVWTFLGENWTDEDDDPEVPLLLSLYHDQPGMFCCDNGYCIHSKLRQISTLRGAETRV